MNQFVLCYVDDKWAYFTTQALKDQWGDDWDDAPFEHNAGLPYEFDVHDAKKGKEPWQIMKVAFETNLETPNDYVLNSTYSVEQINNRAVPWLQSGEFGARDEQGKIIQIWAGCTIDEFIKLIEQSKGDVYLKFTPGD